MVPAHLSRGPQPGACNLCAAPLIAVASWHTARQVTLRRAVHSRQTFSALVICGPKPARFNLTSSSIHPSVQRSSYIILSTPSAPPIGTFRALAYTSRWNRSLAVLSASCGAKIISFVSVALQVQRVSRTRDPLKYLGVVYKSQPMESDDNSIPPFVLLPPACLHRQSLLNLRPVYPWSPSPPYLSHSGLGYGPNSLSPVLQIAWRERVITELPRH